MAVTMWIPWPLLLPGTRGLSDPMAWQTFPTQSWVPSASLLAASSPSPADPFTGSSFTGIS